MEGGEGHDRDRKKKLAEILVTLLSATHVVSPFHSIPFRLARLCILPCFLYKYNNQHLHSYTFLLPILTLSFYSFLFSRIWCSLNLLFGLGFLNIFPPQIASGILLGGSRPLPLYNCLLCDTFLYLVLFVLVCGTLFSLFGEGRKMMAMAGTSSVVQGGRVFVLPCSSSSSGCAAIFGDEKKISFSICVKKGNFFEGFGEGRRGKKKVPVVSAVLTDISKEFLTLKVPQFEKHRADPREVVSVILGGGAGTRLFPLTRRRAKPAVPIGGCYRLIDVPMSNCINSGINKIFILTQFNSASLNRHLARTYGFGNGVNFGDGFVEPLAATQTPGEDGKKWFQGTADAVRQFTWILEDATKKHIEHVLILSGDHLYRMDYMDFIQKHIDTGADITISCVPMDDSRASDYGLMKIDDRGRVLYFSEKPKGADLKAMEVDTKVLGLSPEEAKIKPYIASMGIYVFRTDILLNLLRWRYPTANDFGSEIIPAAAKEYNVQAYLFNDYWEDIGTIKSFFDANLALADQPPKFRFYDPMKPVFTSPRFLPPTKIEKCRVVDSIISHGCFLRECSVQHSIVGIRSRLDYGAELKDTMMMGADYYETEAEIASALAEGKVPIGVGLNTKIRNCIIDKNARIGKNVMIVNTDNVEEAERPSEGYYIRSGITVILKNSIIKDGTVI